MASALPIYKSKSIGSYGGWTKFTNFRFIGFSAKTKCGQEQNIFEISKYGADYNPINDFTNVVFTDVEDAAFAYIYDPPESWANISDCGEWPCTAPSNAVFTFDNVQYSGITPSKTYSTFQVVGDIATAAGAY